MGLSKERGLYFQEKWEEMEYRFANIEMKKEIERLNKELDKTRLSELHKEYVINELEKYLKYQIERSWEIEEQCYENIESKLQELKGSNEPSFEEMVGFVENVYKDIKSQPTLHEELEEERKTIVKIVGDFKEVISNE